MREVLEFRIPESIARVYLGEHVGRRIGPNAVARVVRVIPGSAQYEAIRAINSRLMKDRESLFVSWRITRTYSTGELSRAELLRLYITTIVDWSAEDLGTTFDDSGTCKHRLAEGAIEIGDHTVSLVAFCGVGRIATNPLKVDSARIPRSADIVTTIAGDEEWLISSRFADVLEGSRLTGYALLEVEDCRDSADRWYQLTSSAPRVDLDSSSRFGIDPFDVDPTGQYRCPEGHTAGLNILSEAYVRRATWDGSDFVVSRIHIGYAAGLVRPTPLIFVSQRLYQTLRKAGVEGWSAEIARLVD